LQAQTAIAEAQILWRSVGWRNLILRIPATLIMLPVIEELICDRINVNATFVFSQTTYEQVRDAYLRGLESLIQQGESVSDIVSGRMGMIKSRSIIPPLPTPHDSGVTGIDMRLLVLPASRLVV
jgi:transaldolase